MFEDDVMWIFFEAGYIVYLKAVDRHRHIKAFIVRCGCQSWGGFENG